LCASHIHANCCKDMPYACYHEPLHVLASISSSCFQQSHPSCRGSALHTPHCSPALDNYAQHGLVTRRLPSGQQMVYFFSFLGGGVLFLFMAFFIGLPTLLLSPSKFALFFTLGCCFVMSGFAALKGWRSQMSHMLQRERLPFSAGRAACLQWHNQGCA